MTLRVTRMFRVKEGKEEGARENYRSAKSIVEAHGNRLRVFEVEFGGEHRGEVHFEFEFDSFEAFASWRSGGHQGAEFKAVRAQMPELYDRGGSWYSSVSWDD
ncbi:MAG: hypothetical protein ACR2QO_13660 [Acidimicrobiales bacterium]